jgi:hypothetical protein
VLEEFGRVIAPGGAGIVIAASRAKDDAMRNTASLRVWLYVAFAGAILGFMLAPRNWPAWVCGLLWVPAFAAGIAYMWLERAENRLARKDAANWLARYNTLVDAHDVPDDGHLYEYLAPEEWARVFALVEQMPPGDRSLRRAIREVDPSFDF